MADHTVDQELETLIRARYPIIYIVSWEERRVEETLREICQKRGKKMLMWTYTSGVAGNVASRDPLAALEYILNAPDQTVFVFKDFHPFITDVAVTRRLRDLISVLKTSYKTLIILSPILKLPPELEKEITVVDYQLPTPGDLDRLLEEVIQSVRANPNVNVELTHQQREQVIQAASGLTSNEAENVFAKSLVEKKSFDVDVILSEKEQIIRKSGILEYYPASEAFADVGGMDLLKDWMRQRTASFGEEARKYGLPEPRGILLLGVQGCGKSLTAKSVASLWRLPLLRLDVGKIFAGIVGSSEENMRKAIATAESVAPCVSGDTRITLADGSERTIQSLYDGQDQELYVQAMTDDFQLTTTRVRAVTRREAPDLFRVRLRHGQVDATSNHLHPILRDGKLTWVRTDALAVGDYIAVPARIATSDAPVPTRQFLPEHTRLYGDGLTDFAPTKARTPQREYARRERGADFVRASEIGDGAWPTWSRIIRFVTGRGGTCDSVLTQLPEFVGGELGYLLGLLHSDGYIGKHNRIGFVNTDKALHARFARLLCEQFGLGVKMRLMNDALINDVGESALVGTSADSVFCPCFTSYVNNSVLSSVLRALGDNLLALPQDVLRAYVRGYFDGDGCISAEGCGVAKVTLTCKKPEGNVRLRSVLHRIGFATTNHGSYNVEITGWKNVQRFIAEVGSEHPCRRERMDEWAAQDVPAELKDRCDAIPVGNLLRQARQEIGMGSQHFGAVSSSLLYRYEHGIGHPNRDRLRDLVEQMQTWTDERGRTDASTSLVALAHLANAPIAWSPVASVEVQETPQYVYDLVCDNPHTFLANGIVTHNCVLWLDELEKGFAGTQSSGMSDGGTTSRVFGSFITWLQEKKSACFVVATSNDVSQLPPEMMRKGRFDEIFFVDLPAAPERREIFSIHLKKRGRDAKDFDLDRLAQVSIGFSGAEIEEAVVSALVGSFNDNLRPLNTGDVLKAVQETVPLSVTMSENIERLREWASIRARPSSSAEPESTEAINDMEMMSRIAAHPMFAGSLSTDGPPAPPMPQREAELIEQHFKPHTAAAPAEDAEAAIEGQTAEGGTVGRGSERTTPYTMESDDASPGTGTAETP